MTGAMTNIKLDRPVISASALHELKGDLRISISDEDALLMGHIRTAMDICEKFISARLLLRRGRVEMPICSGWQMIKQRPIISIYDVEGKILVMTAGAAGRIRAYFDVGCHAHWDDIDAPLRMGILRLAAFLYRQNNGDIANENMGEIPPVIAALWRPYRAMRL
ncbi:hypothetical protein LPB140_11105 [Sphingorhabdus lutea]|uniref:Phage gp6-like head-tail connector protein n=1 Tax=Sphingorhabdus lutea TaxID=1913578 RepID=A0A1L3JDW4_9SPHN|nr:hypothetical protein [Sphingorhabdus lutea]APG63243.1 hypothetical protein LPB140_11105 [Sphingorhabdus lutea]